MIDAMTISLVILLSIIWGTFVAAAVEASGALEACIMTEKPITVWPRGWLHKELQAATKAVSKWPKGMRDMTKRNPVAEALTEGQNKPKTVPSKKVYNRKNKTVDIDEE